MRCSSFAEVLDDALGRPTRDSTSASGSAWAWRSEPPLGSAFLFARPLISRPPRWTADARPPEHRPAHRFTRAQREAFDRLVLLGAELSAGFTAEELRREYRQLARRYHPDRHGGCSALERGQRARCFAHAAEDYRRLRELVEPRH